MTTLVEIPFKNTTITATNENGVWVPMKNLCDYFGVNHESERQKLSRKSWATTCKMQAVAEDGKSRELLMMDRQTMTMWLGTLDEKRVSEDVRPFLVDFQKNAANALDSYFHEGGAINPNASAGQLDKIGAQLGELRAQAEIAHLFEQVWNDHYAEDYEPSLMDELA